MPRYFIGMYQPQGVMPSPESLEPVMRELGALNQELHEAGALVFSNGFDQSSPPRTVTASRDDDLDAEENDGAVLPGDVQLGGFTIVDLADEDAASAVATRIAEATGLPIEIRVFADRG